MPLPRPAAHSFRDLLVWRKTHESTKLSASAEEISRLLSAYAAAILTPGS